MKPLFKTILKALAVAASLTFLLALYNKDKSKNTDSFTDPRDGHVYKTVTIGNQTWMAENLAYLPKINPPSEISESKSKYYVYNFDGDNVSVAKATDNYKMYGVLYNWNAAMKSCPTGWHLPSDKEWARLENYLISNGYNYDKTLSGNKIAKSLADTNGWVNNGECEVGEIGNDLSSNNRSGFSALPGGHYEGNGRWVGIGEECRWWSKKEFGNVYAWVRLLRNDYSNDKDYKRIGLCKVEDFKYHGVSVRCVKD
jgi:uncharacterized protein (TIGR02145 family)